MAIQLTVCVVVGTFQVLINLKKKVGLKTIAVHINKTYILPTCKDAQAIGVIVTQKATVPFNAFA
jgi:hypothetical protein